MTDIRNVSGRMGSIDIEAREVTFVSSNETKDRHGTVLNQDNWRLENFNSNGIIGYQHNVYGNDMCEKATPDDVIGKGHSFIDRSTLVTTIKFKPEGRSELADKVFEDVRDGYLNSVSVGFIPFGEGRLIEDETEKEVEYFGRIPEGHTYYFAGQELLEVSVVNIPSNPTALKKSFRDSTARALTHLVKAFGGEYSLSDLGQMTVDGVLKLLNNDQLELQYDAKKISDTEAGEQTISKAADKEIEEIIREQFEDEQELMRLELNLEK